MASIANEEILRAARDGDFETLSVAARLLGFSLLQVVDQDGTTALHSAAAEGHVCAVELLLSVTNSCGGVKECGSIATSVVSPATTATTAATSPRQVAPDTSPTAAAAAPSTAQPQFSRGNYSVTASSSRGSTRSSEGSLARAQAPGSVKHGLCPSCLHDSSDVSYSNSVNCFKCGKLIESNASAVAPSPWASIASRRGHTALHWAALRGHTDIALQLLRSGFDANAVSNQNATPLHLAGVEGHVETVKLLLDAGADPTICVKSGRNVLQVVEALGHSNVLEALKARAS